MSFASWSEFFHMGGYALYVWGAYALTLIVLSGVIVASWRRHRQLRRALERRARRDEKMQER